MTDTPKTLAQLFADDKTSFASLETDRETQDKIHQDLGIMEGGLLEIFTFAGMLAVLYEALDLSFVDVFRSAWQSTADLQKYLDPEKHPPDETNWIKFGKHKLTSTHKPTVEVQYNGKRVGSIEFDLKLTLNIASTRLRVRDGRIWEAAGAEFEGQCELSYQGLTLVKKKVQKFTLPGGYQFEDGAPILPLPIAV